MEGSPPAGVRQAIESHFSGHQVGRVVYGAIIGIALLVALEQHPPTPGVVVGSLVVTAVAVALAELYSDVIGVRVKQRGHVPRAQLGEMAKDVAGVAFGVAFPSAFFVLAAAGAIKVQTAFDLAEWSGVLLIAFYGFWAARLSGERLVGCLLQASTVALIAVVLIALKSLLH
jgi:hypothetical protein